MRDEYLPLTRAARAVGISRPTVTRLVKAGKLPVYESQLNRRLKLLRIADLEALQAPRLVRPQREVAVA
jgi:excisionase family DNA binding protein